MLTSGQAFYLVANLKPLSGGYEMAHLSILDEALGEVFFTLYLAVMNGGYLLVVWVDNKVIRFDGKNWEDVFGQFASALFSDLLERDCVDLDEVRMEFPDLREFDVRASLTGVSGNLSCNFAVNTGKPGNWISTNLMPQLTIRSAVFRAVEQLGGDICLRGKLPSGLLETTRPEKATDPMQFYVKGPLKHDPHPFDC